MSGIGRLAALLALFIATPALAADPIEEFHLPPTGFATTKGKLRGGTVYTMEISGTRRKDVKSGDQLYKDSEDAFYCFAQQSTNTHLEQDPQCGDTKKGGPRQDNSSVVRTIVKESTDYPLAAILTEGTPGEFNPAWHYPPYRDDHKYTVTFKPHATGRFQMNTGVTCAGFKCSGDGFDIKIFAPEDDHCGSPARSVAHASAINEVRVVAVQPSVQVHKAGTPEDCWDELSVDDVLQQGDEISCDPDGAVTIQFADNSTVTVSDTTQLKIASFFTDGGVVKTEILLKMGQVAAKVHKSEATKSDFRIQTPTSVASVRGTDFSVFYDPGGKSTLTTVREGLVEVDPVKTGLATVQVPAGKEVEVTSTAESKVAAPGKAGARGGLNRRDALARVMKVVAKGNGPCGVRTPRLNATSVKPIGGGWSVAVRLTGKHPGTSKWTVKGKRTKAINALAKRVAKRCS